MVYCRFAAAAVKLFSRADDRVAKAVRRIQYQSEFPELVVSAD